MNKNHTNESNYTKLVMPRQLVLPLDYGILIKETAPVRLLDAVLEELDYKELQHLYSPKGRKSKVPPHILFKIFCLCYVQRRVFYTYDTTTMRRKY